MINLLTFSTGPIDAPVLLNLHPGVYLAIAGLCLVVALRHLKRALEPLGAIVEAAAVAAFAITMALLLVLASAIAQ